MLFEFCCLTVIYPCVPRVYSYLSRSLQAQQALMWCVMRLLWCYGSERFWNFCGHMISDRAHPLTNFINAYNMRRSVDNIPRAWVQEVIAHATTHNLRNVKAAVEHLCAEPTEPEYGVRALFQRSSLMEAREFEADVDPTLLQHVLPQLHADWARVNFTARAIPFSNMCYSVMFCCFPVFCVSNLTDTIIAR